LVKASLADKHDIHQIATHHIDTVAEAFKTGLGKFTSAIGNIVKKPST